VAKTLCSSLYDDDKKSSSFIVKTLAKSAAGYVKNFRKLLTFLLSFKLNINFIPHFKQSYGSRLKRGGGGGRLQSLTLCLVRPKINGVVIFMYIFY
jgi:hypothetical protein